MFVRTINKCTGKMLTDTSLPVRRGNITRKLNWQSAKKREIIRCQGSSN